MTVAHAFRGLSEALFHFNSVLGSRWEANCHAWSELVSPQNDGNFFFQRFGETGPADGGLGNKLMSLRFSFLLAYLLGAPFKVFPVDPSSPIRLQDYFHPFRVDWLPRNQAPPKVNMSIITCERLFDLHFVKGLRNRIVWLAQPSVNVARRCDLKSLSGYLLKNSVITASHHQHFLKLCETDRCFASTLFKFTPRLARLSKSSMASRYHGLHLRWGDFYLSSISAQNSSLFTRGSLSPIGTPLESFINTIKSHLHLPHHPGVDRRLSLDDAVHCLGYLQGPWFICTDNANETLTAVTLCNNSSLHIVNNAKTSLYKQVQHSAMPSLAHRETFDSSFQDLAMLALSDGVTAAARSSLSREAANLGLVPYTVGCDKLI